MWGGILSLMEDTEGVEYSLKGTEEDMGLLLTIHAAEVLEQPSEGEPYSWFAEVV